MNQLTLKDYLQDQDEDYIKESKIYQSNYENHQVEIFVGISFSKIILRILNYEIKFTEEYVNEMIHRKKFNNLYDVYNEIKNIFEEDNYIIMKVSKKEIKIKLIIEDDEINMKKEILFELKNIFENYPYFMKDLFYKNIELEKKVKQLEHDLNQTQKEFIELKKRFYSEFKTTLNIIIDYHGNSVNIVCDSNDLISSVIDKYKLKTGQYFFKYVIRSDSKTLNPDMIVDEAGLGNGSKIYLELTNEDKISENLNLNQRVFFRFINSINQEPVMIPFDANEKVSTLIERFRKRCNLYDEKAKFIYGGKNLNVDLTVEEAHLYDCCKIKVINA
jgi:hypothetical protein